MVKLPIRKYKNTNPESSAYGKTYARVVHQGTLSTNDLCRHLMSHGTIFTPDVVKGTIEQFIMCFEDLLMQGNKIKLDGLGTFYVSITTQGVDNPDDFSASDVKAVRVKFLPDQSKVSEYTTRMLTAKARFRTIDGQEILSDEET